MILDHPQFRRDDVGAPLHADKAAHGDRADRGLNRDRDASLASLAANDPDVIPLRCRHLAA
jgi:hypothetical protein